MLPAQPVTIQGVEQPNNDVHGVRFRVKFKRGWYAIEAQTPLADDQNGEWVRIAGFSHKGDADRYCQFLNEAVTKFFNT